MKCLLRYLGLCPSRNGFRCVEYSLLVSKAGRRRTETVVSNRRGGPKDERVIPDRRTLVFSTYSPLSSTLRVPSTGSEHHDLPSRLPCSCLHALTASRPERELHLSRVKRWNSNEKASESETRRKGRYWVRDFIEVLTID